jgi:ankyrin repeat protein
VIFLSFQSPELALSVLDKAPSTARERHPVTFALPLHFACRFSTTPVVTELLKVCSTDVTIKDKDGLTPLYYAALNTDEYEALNILRLLLDCEEDLCLRQKEEADGDDDGTENEPIDLLGKLEYNPLDYVAKAGTSRGALAFFHKANPNLASMPNKADKDRLPLHTAALSNATSDFLEDLFRAYPKAVYTCDSEGKIPLQLAVCSDMNADGIHVLMARTVTLNESFKTTILHDAIIYRRSPDVFSTILEFLTDGLRVHNDVGDTPIFTLLHNKTEEEYCISVLKVFLRIDTGSATIARGIDGNLPLHTALELSYPPKVIAMLLQAGRKACRIHNHDGKLPLHYACWQSRHTSPQVILALIDIFPEGLWEKELKYGMNPLMYCAQYGGHISVVKKILELDSNLVREVNNDMRLSIHLACQNGASFDIVFILYELYPESIEVIDTRGMTPVQYALERRPDCGAPGDVLRFLLNKRAEKTAEAIKAEPEGDDIHIKMSDFERSSMDYEYRCKMEELKLNKGLRPISKEQFVEMNAMGNSSSSGGGGTTGRMNEAKIASIQQRLRAQADEIRRLKAGGEHALNAAELHNNMKKVEKELKEKKIQMKDLQEKYTEKEKQVEILKEDLRRVTAMLKSPDDVERLKKERHAEEMEQHHRNELLKQLKKDIASRDSQISDLNLDIKNIRQQLNSQIDYAKQQEALQKSLRVEMEEMREELIVSRNFVKTLQGR